MCINTSPSGNVGSVVCYNAFTAQQYVSLSLNLILCTHFVFHRSTADLEAFQNHILMYAGKRFSFSPPVYEARTLLAALDYNQHVGRPLKRTADGRLMYVNAIKS